MENLPEFLVNNLINQYGEIIANKIIDGYSLKRKTTFRVNTIKTDVESIENELKKLKIEYKKVNWYNEAFIIEKISKKEIEELEIYKRGEIYLQSLSSMLPPIILDPKPNNDILDMTAAPGGKTTQIAAMTQNKAHITACEINSIRVERLKYNIEKQGVLNTYVILQDSRKINDFFSFDQILLDSPCSGSGTVSIEDKYLNEKFTVKLVEKSNKSQLDLLRKALKILKPGKEMVYSTCSVLSCENEDIVQKVLNESKAEIIPINFKGIEDLPKLPVKIAGTLCIYPNELFEGFFVAKIKKR